VTISPLPGSVMWLGYNGIHGAEVAPERSTAGRRGTRKNHVISQYSGGPSIPPEWGGRIARTRLKNF